MVRLGLLPLYWYCDAADAARPPRAIAASAARATSNSAVSAVVRNRLMCVLLSLTAGSVSPSFERALKECSSSELLEHAVSHAPHVHDEAILRPETELLANARRVRLQRPSPAERPVAPHLAQERLLREHPIGIGGELRDELELLRRERHGDVAHAHAARRSVDDEVAGDDDVRLRRRAPAQERADAREQLLVGERPADHVVGTAIEGAHALDRVG